MIIDDETSGRIEQGSVLISSQDDNFENFVVLSQSAFNMIIRTQRYGKFFVLKTLAPHLRNNPYHQQLLRKEFDLTIGLTHPNIIRTYSLEQVEPYGLCIVMAYVDGRTLDSYLADSPSRASRTRLMRQLLSALAYCHSQKIIHRDIKPSNILVSKNGDDVCLIDFGLSDADYYAILKEPAFSRRYASPEQLSGEPLDCRTDIYSFGLLLRELFPHRFNHIVRRCCQPQRHRRYETVEAVSKALFSPWRHAVGLMLTVLFVVGLIWAGYSYRHTYISEFEFVAPSGQPLRCAIVDSKAHILGGHSPSGRLEIPSLVRHGLRKYPVAAIDTKAFAHELDLTRIVLPEGLEEIGEDAFSECSSLTDTVVFPESLHLVGSAAFCSTSITHLIIKSKCLVEPNPDYTNIFYSCYNLQQIVIESTVDSIGFNFFKSSNAKSIVAPDHWISLSDAVFSTILNLQEIKLPSRLKSIQTSAFWANSLPRIVLPESVEDVQGYAFRWARCQYLEFGSQLKYIGPCAFANMQWLDTLVIRAPKPPRCPLDLYDGSPPSNAILLVPPASVELYKADSNFAPFSIKAIPSTSKGSTRKSSN